MYRKIINFLNKRQLKKMSEKIKSQHDILYDIRILMDSGFTQIQAITIVNVINDMK